MELQEVRSGEVSGVQLTRKKRSHGVDCWQGKRRGGAGDGI